MPPKKTLPFGNMLEDIKPKPKQKEQQKQVEIPVEPQLPEKPVEQEKKRRKKITPPVISGENVDLLEQKLAAYQKDYLEALRRQDEKYTQDLLKQEAILQQMFSAQQEVITGRMKEILPQLDKLEQILKENKGSRKPTSNSEIMKEEAPKYIIWE